MFARLALLMPVALLVGCEKGEPTRVTINTGNQTSEKGGKVEVGSSGFKADLSIPGLSAMGSHMDLDGVRLYPESKVNSIDVNGADAGESKVTLQFTSPADHGKVAEHFARQFKDGGFTARRTPTGFAGETSDGNWFTLDLKGAGAASTIGEFKLGERQR